MVGRIDTHCPSRHPSAVERHTEQLPDLIKCSVLLVFKKKIWCGVIRHKNIDPAVLIEIDKRGAQSFRNRHACRRIPDVHARRFCNLPESPISVVVVEVGEPPFELRRWGISTVLAVEGGFQLKIQLSGPVDVIADEEVEMTITIVIKPTATRAPFVFTPGDPRLGGDIGENSGLIFQEVIAPHRG